jgi:hypothetical protein
MVQYQIEPMAMRFAMTYAGVRPWRLLGLTGIDFIDENGGGPGVRLRKRQPPKEPK